MSDEPRPKRPRKALSDKSSPDGSEDGRKRLGTRGEQIAAVHLERLGWRIRMLNFRCPQGEIDVIAEEPNEAGNVLVFVEVKTRHGVNHGTPSEAVNARKQQKLIGAAQAYLGSLNAGGAEPPCRFDIAEVYIDSRDLARVELRRASFMED